MIYNRKKKPRGNVSNVSPGRDTGLLGFVAPHVFCIHSTRIEISRQPSIGRLSAGLIEYCEERNEYHDDDHREYEAPPE